MIFFIHKLEKLDSSPDMLFCIKKSYGTRNKMAEMDLFDIGYARSYFANTCKY